MAYFNRIKGVHKWMKARGYSIEATQQIIKCYNKCGFGRLIPYGYYAKIPKRDSQFINFSNWVINSESHYEEFFDRFMKYRNDIPALKTVSSELRVHIHIERQKEINLIIK